MKQRFKYGLRDARALLEIVRNSRVSNNVLQERDVQQAEKTFISEHSLDNNQHTFQPQPQDFNYHKVQLSQIIINKHLEQTANLFQKDLQLLSENKDNLLGSIQVLADKIQSLKDLQNNNKEFEQVILKKQEKVKKLIQKYHDSYRSLEQQRNRNRQYLTTARNNIRTLMNVYQEDACYRGYMEQWGKHLQLSHQNQDSIRKTNIHNLSDKVSQLIVKKQRELQYKQQASKDQIVLTKKPKKRTEAQKAQLLGGLKQFSKNFKIP